MPYGMKFVPSMKENQTTDQLSKRKCTVTSKVYMYVLQFVLINVLRRKIKFSELVPNPFKSKDHNL